MEIKSSKKSKALVLSGYRIMWVMVMFDLPVQTKEERRQATRFRSDLLDLGFSMSQFSVYMKFCGNDTAVKSMKNKIGSIVPERGTVSLITFTDKQYEKMKIWYGKKLDEAERSRKQLLLF